MAGVATADPASPLLAGVRVVEFSQLLAAPFCGLTLADLGARVIKVEPAAGDATRGFPPFLEAGESGWFHCANRGKRGIALNLGDARAGAIARRLIDEADVVLENLGGARARLGIDHATARARNPKLIWCSITGLGADRGGRAVDPSLQAQIGIMATTGEAGGPPVRVQAPTIDLMTGMYAVQRVLAALWRVERGGDGAFLDCAMLDAAATLTGTVALLSLGGHLTPGRVGSDSYLVVPSAVFAGSDGGHLQVIAVTEEHWRAVCVALGHREWMEDPRCADNAARLANRELVHARIRDVIATDTAARWVAAITEAGGICETIKEIDEAWADPSLIERGLLGSLAANGLNSFQLPVMSLAREADPATLTRGPRLGEHSDELLRELGIEDEERAALRRDGVVVGP
ncbi:MAG TPA: CoA transferase [Solirubrobacteraceae bacterium]|nr:CoA transferase [Solirubrobacteraceae bacterium]